MSKAPSYPEQPIETAVTHYNGWVTFTRFATYGIVATVILLAVMAATLV